MKTRQLILLLAPNLVLLGLSASFLFSYYQDTNVLQSAVRRDAGYQTFVSSVASGERHPTTDDWLQTLRLEHNCTTAGDKFVLTDAKTSLILGVSVIIMSLIHSWAVISTRKKFTSDS